MLYYSLVGSIFLSYCYVKLWVCLTVHDFFDLMKYSSYFFKYELKSSQVSSTFIWWLLMLMLPRLFGLGHLSSVLVAGYCLGEGAAEEFLLLRHIWIGVIHTQDCVLRLSSGGLKQLCVCLAPKCLSNTFQRKILSQVICRSGFWQTLGEHSLCIRN